MSTTLAERDVLTGFGDEVNASIKFQLLKGRNGDDPAWAGGEAKLSTFEPLHSNDAVTQYQGRGQREMTARLLFADADDMELLDSVRGRQATLRYGWGITTRAGGHKATLPDGVSYLVLPGTLLVTLTDQTRYRNGKATATATFRRAVGAASVAGFAQAIETGE